jgi:hypothetical protein
LWCELCARERAGRCGRRACVSGADAGVSRHRAARGCASRWSHTWWRCDRGSDCSATSRSCAPALTQSRANQRAATRWPLRRSWAARRSDISVALSATPTDQNFVRDSGSCRSCSGSDELQRSASDVRARRGCHVAPVRYLQHNAPPNATSRDLQHGDHQHGGKLPGHHVSAISRAARRRRQGPKAPRERGRSGAQSLARRRAQLQTRERDGRSARTVRPSRISDVNAAQNVPFVLARNVATLPS